MSRELNHQAIALYLKKLGWTAVKSNREAIDIYLEPETTDPIEILIPNQITSGSDQIIQSAIKILSSYLDQSKDIIEKSILGIDKDFHNFRIENPFDLGSLTDSAPVTLIETLVSSARYMLHDASQFHSKQDYDKLSREEKKRNKPPSEVSESYLKKCRFLHTWVGSFGITIEAPLQVPTLGLLENNKMPDSLGRKTTKSILKGFSLVSEAVEKKSIDYLFDKISDSREFLIFSHFSDLLRTIQNNKIEYTVAASPIIKLDESFVPARNVKLDRRSLEYIDMAVEKLKTSDVVKRITFVGFPEAFRSSKKSLLTDGDLEGTRKVTVKGTSKDIGHASLTLLLSLEDYLKALKAQEEAKDVKVVCEVQKVAKGWEVIAVQDFRHI